MVNPSVCETPDGNYLMMFKKHRKPDAYYANIKETDFIQCKSFRENVKNNTQRTWLWDNP